MKRKKAKSRPQYSAPERSLKAEADTVFVARDLLDNIARRLDIGVSSAVVCRLALDGQNAECDQDIATVLQWSVADELQRQIERIDQISRIQSKTDRTKQGRRRKARGHGKPTKAKALRVPRSVLNDIRYRLSLVGGSTTVCRVALETQHAERDVDIAAMLKHVVIDIIRTQLERIRGVTTVALTLEHAARKVPSGADVNEIARKIILRRRKNAPESGIADMKGSTHRVHSHSSKK